MRDAGGCDELCALITLAVAGVADLLDGAHNAPRPVDAHVKPLEIPRRPCNLIEDAARAFFLESIFTD